MPLSHLCQRFIVLTLCASLLSGCGSIISRTLPGQGHGNQYYPGVQWDVRDGGWRWLTILDLPLSLLLDTLLLPVDIQHGPWE
ncbi:YceK/YidQ family lipoprotein [Pantoea sp. 1.19]|uniref:YceK/YidQ family lipoprotein n=1 Tax=Pantoea sp. 1.19 TaxID=1925589 RepID=UPI0009490186|nr:YceK/YidQ family lipoprotein [Pantoea sp. 1.19]